MIVLFVQVVIGQKEKADEAKMKGKRKMMIGRKSIGRIECC